MPPFSCRRARPSPARLFYRGVDVEVEAQCMAGVRVHTVQWYYPNGADLK